MDIGQTCSNVPHSVATSSSDMYSSDTEAIDYFGSDDGIETTSGSSDDEQGADTSHSVEDMIVSVCPSLQHPQF